MRRREVSVALDWLLLGAGIALFATGLVLLLCFHMGRGAFAREALGVGKLVWLNVHRLAAVVVAAGVGTHVGLHWRAVKGRLVRLVGRRGQRRFDVELVLYLVFGVAAVTGLAAWLIVEGSSPLLGPAVAGVASGGRHRWIDVHHVSSLVSLALVVHHVGHRWRGMLGRARRAA